MISQAVFGQEASWQEALQALQQDKSVGFPTETVWGLGVAAYSERAVKHLSAIKGRDARKALQVSCLDIEQAFRLVLPGQARLERLATLLPGPLTLVAWAGPACPAWLHYGGKVGLRVAQHPTIQELLQRYGEPLATSSLNLAGQAPARTLAEAQAYGLTAVLLGDPSAAEHVSPLGLPSTVVDCTTGDILRQGAIGAATIQALLEER